MTWIHRLVRLLVLAGAAACSVGPALSPLPTPGAVGAAALVYPLERGWFEGRAIHYYNLGGNTPLDPADPGQVLSAPVWVFATGVNADGSPIQVDGQDSLFDTRTGDGDYTDLWQVTLVTPPPAYTPNSVTSLAALEAAGLAVAAQPMFVNCPEVPPGSSLVDQSLELKDGWVRGERVTYFDFGPTSPVPGKVYVFVTGFDAAGQPHLVDGQAFVFDAAPGERGYSDFWRVHWVQVGADYVADSLRAVADLDPALITASDRVMNFPQQ